MTLDHLAVGGRARVTAVGGDTAIRRRLLEMGLTPGIAVALIRRAPLGDPLELLVRDYQLSLRRDQARLVTIVPA
jgi:Fe2+ transport system protein FeoA